LLLLENVNTTGVDILKEQGYQVEALKASLPEDELVAKIREVHVIGIRSKTKAYRARAQSGEELDCDWVFLYWDESGGSAVCGEQGIAVFNSPFSNSRSVAEAGDWGDYCAGEQFGGSLQ